MNEIFDDDKSEVIKLKNARETLEELLTLSQDVGESTDVFTYDLAFAKMLAAIRVYFVSKGKKDDDAKDATKQLMETDSWGGLEYQEEEKSIQSLSDARSPSSNFHDLSGSLEISENQSQLSNVLETYADVRKSNSKPIKRRSMRNRTTMYPSMDSRERLYYTEEEDEIIREWVREHPGLDVKALATWERMADTCYRINRTPKSLQTRYHNYLKFGSGGRKRVIGFSINETEAMLQWLRDNPYLDGYNINTWRSMIENRPNGLRHSSAKNLLKHFREIIRFPP